MGGVHAPPVALWGRACSSEAHTCVAARATALEHEHEPLCCATADFPLRGHPTRPQLSSGLPFLPLGRPGCWFATGAAGQI